VIGSAQNAAQKLKNCHSNQVVIDLYFAVIVTEQKEVDSNYLEFIKK